MSDPISDKKEASPGVEPSRQLKLPGSATMVRQGGAMIRPEMLMRVEAEMETGERLLWTGRPRRWQIPWNVAVPGVFWGTILTWMGCYLFYWGVTGYYPLIGTSMGCIVTACGLVLLHSLVRAGRTNDRTIYAITDRRALILNAGRELTVQSFQPGDLGAIHRTELRNGRGDLIFQGKGMYNPDVKRELQKDGFYGIPGVRAVEKLARNVLKGPPSSDTTENP